MTKTNKILIGVGIFVILAIIGTFMKKETSEINHPLDSKVEEKRDFNYKIIQQAPYGLAGSLGYKYIVKVDHNKVSKNDLYKLAKFLFNLTDKASTYKEFTLFVNDDVEGHNDISIFKLMADKCCFLEDSDIAFEEVNFKLEKELLKD